MRDLPALVVPAVTKRKQLEGTIAGTFNPNCPSCKAYKVHVEDDWKMYHPEAGNGYSREHGSPRSAKSIVKEEIMKEFDSTKPTRSIIKDV